MVVAALKAGGANGGGPKCRLSRHRGFRFGQ